VADDPNHAVVTFRSLERDQPDHVNLMLTPAGWRVVLPGNAIEKLAQRLHAAQP
jgi:hypothetical protein